MEHIRALYHLVDMKGGWVWANMLDGNCFPSSPLLVAILGYAGIADIHHLESLPALVGNN